jgi:zinc protease
VYGSHPYGHLPIGDEAALLAMSRALVARAHASTFRADRATLVVAGGLSANDLLRHAELVFADWGTSGPAAAATGPSAEGGAGASTLPPTVARHALVDRPGAAQSELRIGRLAVPRSTPDYFGLIVMNAVLGGQFISRLNLKLREERAFTYGARTAFDWHRGVSPFALHTSVHTASTATAVADVWQELDALRGARPVQPSELEQAKASLTRGYPQGFQTVPQVARAVCQLAIHGLPDDYFSRLVPSVHAVTADEVTRLAHGLLDPATMTTLVVGDAAVVGEPLAQLGTPFDRATAW